MQLESSFYLYSLSISPSQPNNFSNMRYLFLSLSICRPRKGPDWPCLGHVLNPSHNLKVQGNGVLWSLRPRRLDCYMRKGVGENHSGQFTTITPTVHYTIYKDPGRITLFHFHCHKTTIYHPHRLYGSGIWMGYSRDGLSLFQRISGLRWKTWSQGLDSSEGSFTHTAGSRCWHSA